MFKPTKTQIHFFNLHEIVCFLCWIEICPPKPWMMGAKACIVKNLHRYKTATVFAHNAEKLLAGCINNTLTVDILKFVGALTTTSRNAKRSHSCKNMFRYCERLSPTRRGGCSVRAWWRLQNLPYNITLKCPTGHLFSIRFTQALPDVERLLSRNFEKFLGGSKWKTPRGFCDWQQCTF